MECFARNVAWKPGVLDDRGLETVRSGADCSGATGRSAADHEDVTDSAQGRNQQAESSAFAVGLARADDLVAGLFFPTVPP